MTTVFHGTNISNAHRLLITGERLYVTESDALAQRYADAQATREVSSAARYAAGSVVFALHTNEEITWRRRSSAATLDVCETTIKEWSVKSVTVYATPFNLRSSIQKIDGEWINPYAYLVAQLGNRVTVIEVEE